MILTCQKCSTSFRLDETLLKATGSKVRCSLCQHMWVAFPPEAPTGLRPDDGDDDSSATAAALGAAALGAGAAAAGLADDAADREPPADTPPELKFFLDGEVDETSTEEEDLVTEEINLDELDQLLSDDGEAVSGPAPEEDFKTEELDLADLEKMLLDTEGDGAAAAEAAEPEAAEDADQDDIPVEDLEAEAFDKEDSVIEELDLDLEDLENLLDEDTGLGDQIASVEESTGGFEATGDDSEGAEADAVVDEIALDMAPELEDLLEDEGGGPTVEETEELGEADMADVLATSDQPTAKVSDEDQDFDFELAPGLEDIFDEDDDREVPIEETEDLDFSELGHALAREDQSQQAQEEELELDLDADTTDGPAAADKDAAPELDLSDLSQALGDDAELSEDAGVAEMEPELELEMDLEGGEAEGAEELDLVLEEADLLEPSTPAGATDDIAEETRELESDELEALLESAGQDADLEEEGSSDSLELDIDLDGPDTDGGDASDDATRELALDDIEKILEMEGSDETVALETDSASEDLDLNLDMDAVTPPLAEADEIGEETTDAGGAIDLSELEKMLDVEDATDTGTTSDEDLDDLDLDFELQPATDDHDDLDLEFDMMDEEPAEASALFDTSESEDLGLDIDADKTDKAPDDLGDDLDFEIMDDDLVVEDVDLDIDAEDIGAETLSDTTVAKDDGRPAGPPHNRDLTQELMDEMAAADTQTMAAPPMETKPIKPAPPPRKRKKKTSKSLVLLLVLALLGGAGYLLPKYTDIKLPAIKMPDLSNIPFIGDFFGPSSPEAVVPVEPSLQGDWVQNQRAGRLYTIQGRVRNEYQNPRSFIRVTGRVYANGRQFQRAATAYCGNVLSPEQLATLPLADINTALGNRSGADNRNVNVASGQEIPFMVVFGDLPPDVELQEFAVEISGSLPVAGDQ